MHRPRAPRLPERHVRRGFTLALLLAAVQFYLHTQALFLLATSIQAGDRWLVERAGIQSTGRLIILLVFLALFAIHFLEATAWGVFLRWRRLSADLTEGIYFSAASITGLGYGDVVLPSPWRLLGPVIAITGLLMFGCSTAFLFLVLQKLWAQHI